MLGHTINQHGQAHPAPDAGARLSTQTVAWLAGHPRARQFVGSVWDKLAELEQAGHYPGAIDALRGVLTHHQPTSAGRCRTCRRWTSRRRPFPCIVWHQIRSDLLGLFAGGDQHRPTGRTTNGPQWRARDTNSRQVIPGRLRRRLSGPPFTSNEDRWR